MARKYDFISELYNRTCKTVVANPASWEAFLRSACYNYRLRFDEQLLVHAQRPDATAVLQIDDWNQKFGRWVNRGAHGIAVFEDADQRRQRLVHYFDISDTHPSRFSRRVPIWQMRDEYTAEVIDTLESTFGELNDKETLAVAIESAARNAVEDNIPDYLTDLLYSVKDSFLDGVSEEEITHIFKTAVRNSVAYMTMTRLGIEAGEYFEPDDLRDVVNFTTPATLNALGYATSDIAEMGLAEISRTILALDRQNRIIAEKTKADYNVGKEKTERSPDDERDHLHDAGGLSAPRSDNAGAAGAVDGQVRPDAEEVPEGASQGTLLQPADELRPERASERHGAQSERDGTDADGADGGVGGRDGEPESDGYDELGSEDEQHPEPSAGNRDGGGNLRLGYYDRSHEDKSLPFFGGDDTIREILGTTPHLKASKDEIRAFFEATADEDARISYIKRIFNNDYTEVILRDGRRVGYKTYQNVLQLWEGSYLSRTAQSFYDWGVIAQHFEAMRLLGELQDTMKPLPSIDGQLSLMTAGAEERKPSAFAFSQEIIDAVLTRGSGISEGKMRIYEQFQKSLSAKENAVFLKNEYGWGGAYPAIVGADIDEQHDGKGIRISKGIGSDKPHIDLKWSQVEKRIAELIKLDRYLNPKEKAQYPEWLQRQEERRAELAEERRNREILSTAPSEKTEPENERYEYHLGSTVYLGANEYEILSFDDERVMLYDTQFPLFNKEMTRTEFDSKVQENPLNDHLKVVEKHREEKAVEFDIGMGYLGNGLTVWNRAVEVNGDYQNIAHISPEGEITFYVQDLPQSVVERIRQAAEREKPKNTELPEFYQAYLEAKADDPNSLVLYQMGDFFEAYADDAKIVGEALDLMQTTRAVDKNFRIPMVGFPQHRLETYLTMLTDRGYDVAVNALEDGERITRTVVSTTKEAPIESKPIGRIDYLGTDGKVGESIEYTSPYQFEKDIKEENYYGVPMSIVLYKDKDGNTIPHSFIAQLDPPPKGFEIIDSPYLPENALDKAKHLIDDFCREEYQREDGADYTDLTNVGIAYTTTEDDKHEIQARVNLVDFRIETLADGKVIRSEQYSSLEELTEKGLQALSFDDLVYLSEEELAQVEAPLTPVWEHPKKSRVQTFDIHPEIPMADRHTFDLASHEVEEVNKKERFHRNYAAITVLKRCQEENRFATPDEQIILSKYVGWGGIPEAFDERAGSWQTEFGMLKNILTPEEYASARESTLTAFYTPPTVINAVYKVMKQLGFREGNILEPSCGIGNFIGMLPEEMKESKIYGVELDTISAGIAQQLYQKSSIAAQGFEETFREVLTDALEDECSVNVVQNVHTALRELVLTHKETRAEEPLAVTRQEVGAVLEHCGVSEPKMAAFNVKYDEAFGGGSEVPPQNLLGAAQLEYRTPDVVIRVNPDRQDLVQTRVLGGAKYRAKQTDGTFFSSRIVRDITDIIRFAQSPWDGALFRRIYYKFCAGIPKAVAERAAAHNPTAEPLLLAVADDDVSPYTLRQCRMLQTHLQNLRTEKANRAVYRIVAFMGYGDYLDQCGADKSRAEILEALGAQEPDPLRLLERLDELQALLRQPKSEARGLILSTVHSSKGLEYDRVFLLDVIDGVFPKEGEDVDRDEERRLFYVAMTRARNELAVFTFPPEKTSSAFSQFLFRPKRRIPRKSKKKTAADSFLPGTPVQHSAYGAGRILAREGDRVRIRFSSGSERVFSLAAAVPNGLLSLRQESGGNAAKAD